MGRRYGSLPVAGLLAATLHSLPAPVHAQVGDEMVDEAIYAAPRLACPCVGPIKGAVLIAGGGVLSPEIFSTFVRLAGRQDAHIVIIPTAGADDAPPVAEIEAMRAAGAKSVEVLHTRDHRVADTEAFVTPLRRATGVWLSGGRQWRLMEAYRGTLVHRGLHEVLDRGGVVGGTSAGASALASYLVRGTPDGTTRVSVPGNDVGLGLLRGVAVDQHLLTREREGELQRIVELYPQLLGIGLDEGTALVIRGDLARVEGVSQVAIYDQRGWQDPVTFRFLDEGDSYDLGQWHSIREVEEMTEAPGS